MSNLVNITRRDNPNTIKLRRNQNVHNSILDYVGNTPLVKLNKIPKKHGVECAIFVKCEFMNPAGSIKDRIGVAMMQDAKSAGVIKENTEFVEETSGNTGIAIAFNAAILGKKCTIVMDEKNSSEKVDTMRLMGAEVLKLKGGEIEVARQIKDKKPNTVVMLDQFVNHNNPRIHYDTTGAEIVSAMEKVDMAVMGAGTGGTISGIGLKLKETYPDCLVVAGEPEGSIMFNKFGKEHPFLVEGIGGHGNLIVLDRSIVDHFEDVTDQESFLMARELAKEEGILCGGSSGCAVAAAIKAARRFNIGAGKNVVVVLPDGIRNYMTKFVTDQWMEARLFMDPPERTMRRFVGAISKDSLRNFATNPLKLPNSTTEEFNFEDPVTKHLAKDCYTLAENGKKGKPTIGLLSRILDITRFVIVGEEGHDNDTDSDYFIPKGVVTGSDVLQYIYELRKY
ncbi:unnamed protein product [Arctia plantaginis]|uniref:Tryptophan synthase beta chain-like PALP domain-containing protein n=1 Tax=Arctia plantaginis TaxID=874455 RepID=A0A8S1ARV1_ARCPL|nr:unnamed protein product [Arctia plantaginis]